MQKYIDQLNDFLVSLQTGERVFDTISPLEMLFEFYIHESPPEAESLRGCRRALSAQTAHLSFTEQDGISCAVNALCAEQEKQALMEGIRLGARLVLELQNRETHENFG